MGPVRALGLALAAASLLTAADAGAATATSTASVTPTTSHDGSYVVSWVNPATYETAYLSQSINGGAWTRIATVTGTESHSFIRMGVANYSYKVDFYVYDWEMGRNFHLAFTNVVTVTVSATYSDPLRPRIASWSGGADCVAAGVCDLEWGVDIISCQADWNAYTLSCSPPPVEGRTKYAVIDEPFLYTNCDHNRPPADLPQRAAWLDAQIAAFKSTNLGIKFWINYSACELDWGIGSNPGNLTPLTPWHDEIFMSSVEIFSFDFYQPTFDFPVWNNAMRDFLHVYHPCKRMAFVPPGFTNAEGYHDNWRTDYPAAHYSLPNTVSVYLYAVGLDIVEIIAPWPWETAFYNGNTYVGLKHNPTTQQVLRGYRNAHPVCPLGTTLCNEACTTVNPDGSCGPISPGCGNAWCNSCGGGQCFSSGTCH